MNFVIKLMMFLTVMLAVQLLQSKSSTLSFNKAFLNKEQEVIGITCDGKKCPRNSIHGFKRHGKAIFK